ncbi:MAG: GAF domain-containing sensor histidine kinase [Chlamydiales bacterium]|nr:GAF domain-containing sensor histidine kinase [Chlamydiales bacterium]
MKVADFPSNEEERQALLEELEILDTEEDPLFDNLAKIASVLCQTPIAMISLLDKERQWFKSKVGIDVRETPRDVSFCSHAILQSDIFYVSDSQKDKRFQDNPLVQGPPNVKFYAGYPLDMGEGNRVGTLCVLDDHPRELTDDQLTALKGLGEQVVALLKLRLSMRQLKKQRERDRGLIHLLNHELRNPLTAILGYLSILKDDPHEIHRVIDACTQNSRRMLKIVDEFLLYSQIEEKKLELVRKEMSLNACVNESLHLMGGMLTSREMSVELSLDETLPNVSLDRTRIVQVIDNFISNAYKYARDGKRLLMTSYLEGNAVKLEVKDFGPGIAPEKMDKLFVPFAGSSGSSSSGLGLSIAKQIVELHGGEIGADSHRGQGTTFWFTIPLSEEHL